VRFSSKKIDGAGIVMRGGHATSISHATGYTEHKKISLMQKIRNYLRGCRLRLLTGGVRMSTEIKTKPKKMELEEFCKLFERMCTENSSEMRRVLIKNGILN